MIVVAGGGAAGAAAACLLGQAGHRALVLEREAGPHDKVCGEFLSHEAQSVLREVGLDPGSMGAAPIHTVRLVHRTRVAESALPVPAHGLSRRVLDEALLARAAALGAEVIRGQAVRDTAPDGTLTLDGGTLVARTLFLATGKHDLRGARRQPDRTPEPLVGFKMHLTPSPATRLALRGAVEVLLFRGGYAGLQLIERDRANLCLLVRRERLQAAGGTWDGLLDDLCRESPHLAARLEGGAALFERPLTVSRVPYGFVHRPRDDDPAGLYRLGDQAAVIPSFAGDGVAIALHTARRAVGAFLAGRSARDYHTALRREMVGQIGRAGWIYAAGRRAPGVTVAAAWLWPGLLRVGARATRVAAWTPGRVPTG